MAIPLLASTAANAEASQIVGTINGVINNINSQAAILATTPTSLRNAVVGGDFGSNPWQRTTSITSVANTLTYTADRFWALGGASSSITISRQTTTPPPGFAAVARFQRASSNADVTVIRFGQVFTSNTSLRFQGQPFVLSFYARAGANFSAASSVLNLMVATGTDTDGTAANYSTAGWTAFTTTSLTTSAGTVTTSAPAAITTTTSFARYSVAGVIPTAATQIGFDFRFTPVGTAGTNDFVEITGVQFEQMPLGGVTPTPFEWRPGIFERLLCQHYFYRISEAGAATRVLQGLVKTTTTFTMLVNFPTTMRAAPTTSVSTTTISVGTFTVTATDGTNTTTLTTATAVATGSATVDTMNLNLTSTAALLSVAGQTTFLAGGGGTGTISADAEL